MVRLLSRTTSAGLGSSSLRQRENRINLLNREEQFEKTELIQSHAPPPRARLEPVGPERARIHQGLRARHHLGDQAPGDGPQCEPVMRMPEGKP